VTPKVRRERERCGQRNEKKGVFQLFKGLGWEEMGKEGGGEHALLGRRGNMEEDLASDDGTRNNVRELPDAAVFFPPRRESNQSSLGEVLKRSGERKL